MPFEYKSGERKHPREFGGSPFKALLAEITDFGKQHRKHSLRRYAGLDADETPPEKEEKKPEPSAEECEACKAGECDNPEHLSEEDRGALGKMLGEEEDERAEGEDSKG